MIESFEELLVHEIADLMSAEEQLVEALPKMAEAASAAQLKKALTNHLKETQNQLKRLQEAALALAMEASDRTICKAMKGLVAEGQDCLKQVAPGPIRDAAIIGACQRVEHYEMSAYGTARTYAQQLGRDEVASLLEESFQEEVKADQLLSQVAEALVNPKAAKS